MAMAGRSTSIAELEWLFERASQRRLKNSSSILLYLAQNRQIPAVLLERLSETSDDLVRLYVAYNPRTSTSVIERLSRDPDKVVRQFAIAELQKRTGSSATSEAAGSLER